jgi:hypothetical protein
MLRKILVMGLLLTVCSGIGLYAEPTRWTSLNGPYWVNGVDVAYGSNDVLGQNEWYRYLIAQNAGDSVYYRRSNDDQWVLWNVLPAANRLVSYKMPGYGNFAFCSVYSDRLWKTENGGASWAWLPGSEQLPNKHFSSIEVPLTEDNAGNVVMVGCLGQPDVQSAFYTDNGGLSWNPIGSTSATNMTINDLESFPEAINPPWMAIGTTDGIYQKVPPYDDWADDWQYAAFAGSNVPVLESVDIQGDLAQIAAVEVEGQDGRCDLYYSTSGNPWSSPQPIRIDGNLFNRRVKDMAAVYWQNSQVSCYVATDEGLYLVSFDNPAMASYVSLDYAPLTYDTDIKAVDYRYLELENADDTAYVMAASRFGVYEIKESRNSSQQITYLKVTEIVTGTYYCNVVSASMPINVPGDEILFSLSDMGIVKRSEQRSEGTLVGLAFEPNQSGYTGTDIAAESPVWSQRTNGIGSPDLGSVVVDPNNPCAVLVSTASGVTPPQIWASGDSGRSWIELPLGDIPTDASINCLAASEDDNGGFVAGTSLGVFYLADIFQDGNIFVENDTIDISSHNNPETQEQ